MSITGGIKFFDTSQNLFADGASAAASSATDAANYAIDKNSETYWRSVGSNDTTVETLTITFAANKTISRLLLLDHNWKQFTVKYDVAGTWTNFTSVKGIDGSLSGITETVFADDTAYYEFASVTTGKLQLNITKTQTANAEKYISQIITTTELGTFAGYPTIKGPTHSRNEKKVRALSGKAIVQKSVESSAVELDFSSYPPQAAYNPDFDLIMSLFDRETPFIVWLCGGRRGGNFFKYTLRGFRLKDAIPMQIINDFQTLYTDGIYVGLLNVTVQLEEHT